MTVLRPYRSETATRRDLEPGIADCLDRKLCRRNAPPYVPATNQSIETRLIELFASRAPGGKVTGVQRMGGGASKEQFVFELTACDQAGRYVLRMDPRAAAVEAPREREYEALRAFAGVVPAPRAVWLDARGECFEQPAMIMSFSEGVVKPSDIAKDAGNVSGMGPVLNEHWRTILGPQFVQHLASIHAYGWRQAKLTSFQVPDADTRQAARWQAGWWTRVWHDDKVASLPVVALAEQWLFDNLPAVSELSFVHGDYRTGNYLIDESSARISALLDWELAHIGDFHEDLAWVVQRPFGSSHGDKFMVSGLYERNEFLERYEQESGRKVDRKALHFYEVIAALKGVCVCLGTCVQVARAQHNHQDIVLNWLAGAGNIFHAELCELLDRGIDK